MDFIVLQKKLLDYSINIDAHDLYNMVYMDSRHGLGGGGGA